MAAKNTEQEQLLGMLERHRHGLRMMFSDVTDEEAVARPTVSALCLGGILKHVTYGETLWTDFVVDGEKNDDLDRHAASFLVAPGETVASLLADYAAATRRTDAVVDARPDLDEAFPLPEAPWYPPNTSWSVREVLVHILTETTRHAGHADIIKETLRAP